MMPRYLKVAVIVFSTILLIPGCENKRNGNALSLQDDTIYISVEESFRPVIEEQILAYETSFPGKHIMASYKPEADCLRDYFRDSMNRLVIVTRGLTDVEDRFMFDSLNYHPAWDKVATDAITLLVNARNPDSLFTLDRLQQQLTGEINRDQPVVFDGLKATSTVRYISDSILRGRKFDTSVVKAAKNSREVMNYIAGNEKAIGLVGISWIGNPEDTAQVNMLKKVKIAYVQCQLCNGMPYVKPMQESIITGRYPLRRGLYYITKENYLGLGTSFVNFLKHERGQLIFRRAYLGTVMDFRIRNVKMNVKN